MSRKNINLTDPVEERALAIINKRGFNGLSDMIATLVREEFERRGFGPGAGTLNDAPAAPQTDSPTTPPVPSAETDTSYHKRRKRRK